MFSRPDDKPAAAVTVAALSTAEVMLPSGGVFYGGKKSVSARFLTLEQVAAISSAIEIKDKAAQNKAISNILRPCVLDFDYFDLTSADAYFLRYWLRINSYPRSPYMVTWIHSEPNGVEYPVMSTVTQTSLEIKEIDPLTKITDKRLDWVRVRDQIEMDDITDPAEKYIAGLASMMVGDTLQAKMELARHMPAAIIETVNSHISAYNHGLTEIAFLTGEIEVDGVKKEVQSRVKIELSLRDFFP